MEEYDKKVNELKLEHPSYNDPQELHNALINERNKKQQLRQHWYDYIFYKPPANVPIVRKQTALSTIRTHNNY